MSQRSKRWVDTPEGIAAANRARGPGQQFVQPVATTAQAIEDPAKHGAQWHCLEDGCNFVAPWNSREATRHHATHRRKLTDADRRRLENDAAIGRIQPYTWPCTHCDAPLTPGVVHYCPGSKDPDRVLPHQQQVAAFHKAGLAATLEELKKYRFGRWTCVGCSAPSCRRPRRAWCACYP